MTWWRWRLKQPKEYRVIYVYVSKKKCTYPLHWPETFAEFVSVLESTMEVRFQKHIFDFNDANAFPVRVCNQHTYEALVPTYRDEKGIAVYFVKLTL